MIDTDFPAEQKFDFLPDAAAPQGVIANLTDPGRLRQILLLLRRALYARRRSLAPGGQRSSRRRGAWWRRGTREIALLGQNVNAYHGEGPDGRDWSLARLLARAGGNQGLARLRYTTSHPGDMTEELIAGASG